LDARPLRFIVGIKIILLGKLLPKLAMPLQECEECARGLTQAASGSAQ
jgi:hypothetical protein